MIPTFSSCLSFAPCVCFHLSESLCVSALLSVPLSLSAHPLSVFPLVNYLWFCLCVRVLAVKRLCLCVCASASRCVSFTVHWMSSFVSGIQSQSKDRCPHPCHVYLSCDFTCWTSFGANHSTALAQENQVSQLVNQMSGDRVSRQNTSSLDSRESGISPRFWSVVACEETNMAAHLQFSLPRLPSAFSRKQRKTSPLCDGLRLGIGGAITSRDNQ